MAYYLGIDLGTTYTAAAAERDGVVEALTLGNRTASVPSVVFLRDDGEILVGEAATRRATSDPGRVAREFKRRVGDPTPIILGGTPYAAEMLMARLLRWSVDRVREQQGEPPRAIALTHPANWGPYKLDLFTQAVRQVDLDAALMLPEPVAAATFYASQRRLEPGSVVAVYDLGGGTFDAAMVRRKTDGFETIGTPEGMERLGGIDFDEAVFAHVRNAIGDALERLDPDESAAQTAVARLRQECIDAKEALSSDTDVSIPVLLPGLQTEVRLTRSEFEAMIRPAISETIVALRRAIRSAEVTADDISAVLLVGGSSRIPLVAQMVGAELGRPIAIDAHPKDAIGFGAAIAVAERRGAATPESVTTVLADHRPPPPTVSPDGGRRPAPPPGAAAAAGGMAMGAGALRPPAPGPGQSRPAPPVSPAGARPGPAAPAAPAAGFRPAPPTGAGARPAPPTTPGMTPRPAPPTARPGTPAAPATGANPLPPGAAQRTPAGPAATPGARATPPATAADPVAHGGPGNRPAPGTGANPVPPGGRASPPGPAAAPGSRPAPPPGGAMANRVAPGAPASPGRAASGAAPPPPGRPSGPTSGGYPAAGPAARPGAPGAPTGASPYQAGHSPYQGMPRAGGSPLGGHSSGGFPAMPGGRVTTGSDNKALWIALGVVAAVALLVIIVVSMSGGDENGGGSTDGGSGDTSGDTADAGSSGGESGYTAEVEAAFMGSCTGAGAEQSVCECAYDEVVATIPFDRFVEIEAELNADQNAEIEEMTSIISHCLGES